MQSTLISLAFIAGTASAAVTVKRQELTDAIDGFEAAAPIVFSDAVLEPGAPAGVWALSEEDLVSIFQDNATTTSSSLSKRASTAEECINQKRLGPYPVTNLAVPNPDTPESFKATFANVPQSTGVRVPNYYQVPGWSNLQGSGPGANYLGLQYLTKYDVKQCADICTQANGCAAFNLYIERDPTVSANYRPKPCNDPPSIAAIKCVLYKVPFSLEVPVSSLTGNQGGYRADFLVRIAASQGYNLGINPQPIPGYCDPIAIPGSLQAPSGYIRDVTYDAAVVGSDASYCGIACDQQRQYLESRPGPLKGNPCRTFVGYTLAKNGGMNGTALKCALYTGSQDIKYATNTGQTRGKDVYSVANAYLYNNIADCSGSTTSSAASSATNMV